MINIKTDTKVKTEAQKLAKELGFSLSSVVTASLKQFIRTRELHVSTARSMTPYLEGVLAQVTKDIRTKKNLSKKFVNGKDMDTYLDTL